MEKAPRHRLEALLEQAGAVAFGFAKAEPVDPRQWGYFQEWLSRGFNAGMSYMENYPDIRRDPRLLLEGASTVVSMAFNYRQPNPFKGVATYALGTDYHKVLRKKLKRVVAEMRGEFGGNWRICIDSAPVLERYWAVKCGVGYRSPVHGNIVVPGVGSMVFLAELVTTLDFNSDNRSVLPDEVLPGSPAGCPAGALQPGGVVDASRCINYLTIEKKEELSDMEKRLVGRAVFGCDECLRKAPENQGAAPSVLPEFLPLPGLADFLAGNDVFLDFSESPMVRSKQLMLKFVKYRERRLNN